jgi:hypothetical protein
MEREALEAAEQGRCCELLELVITATLVVLRQHCFVHRHGDYWHLTVKGRERLGRLRKEEA